MATIQKIDKIISFNSTETEWTVDSDTLPDKVVASCSLVLPSTACIKLTADNYMTVLSKSGWVETYNNVDSLPDLAPFCHFAAFAPKKGKVMKKDADWYVNTNCVVAVSSSVYGVVDGITYYDVKFTFESEMSYCFVCNENVELHQDSL
jgi:hypothetical protein